MMFGNEDEEITDEFEGILLHQSCLWDNSDLLSDLLLGDELKHIDSQDSKGRTALHAAVISNSANCARLLLMNGADPNVKQCYDPKSPMSMKNCLHLAAERGQSELVKILIEFNANIFAKDGNGLTAMDLAEQEGHQDVVEILKNAVIEFESIRKELHESLALAVHKGDAELVQNLLAKVKTIGSCESNSEMCSMVEGSAIRIHSKTKILVNYAPNGSNTLLFKACQEGHFIIVKLLIEAGADGRQHPITKYSPLYISSYHGRLKICKLLLEYFPELSAIYTVEHWLPIHAAAINNHQEIVQLLLSYDYPKRVMRRFFVCSDTISQNLNSFALLSSSNKQQDSSSSSTNLLKESHSTRSHSISNEMSSKDCDKQFVYLMPFDVNAQDVAGQSILYLTTLLGNQSLIEFLLNYQFKSISYADYVEQFGVTEKSANNNNSDKELSPTEIETLFGLVFGDSAKEFPEGYESSQDDGEEISSGSSEDITVISSVDKIKSKTATKSSQKVVVVQKDIPIREDIKCDCNSNNSSTINTDNNNSVLTSVDSYDADQINKSGTDTTNRTIASSIQRLIDKLSPTNSPSKETSQSSPSSLITNESSKSTKKQSMKTKKYNKSSIRNKKVSFSKSKLQIYSINPFKIDLYCNYNMETALHCAVKKRHYSIASILLENGANPSLPINGPINRWPPIVTRVSHFNHNFFSPSNVTLRCDLNNCNQLNVQSSNDQSSLNVSSSSSTTSSEITNNNSKNLEKQSSTSDSTNFRSTALREAVRNRDKAMLDLLLRFGATDSPPINEDIEDEEDDVESTATNKCPPPSMSALAIAFFNNDYHFVSKLLSLNAFPDSEFKINKKAFDIAGSNCMNAINKFNMVNNVTVSSMFPSKAVMIDWHQLGIKSLNSSFSRYFSQWLVDSALVYNLKLKLSQVQESSSAWNTALAAITRIDLSNNSLKSVPFCLFTDLPSLKILNLSKNKLQTLPEVEIGLKDKATDDDSIVSIRRIANNTANNNNQIGSTVSSSNKSSSKNIFSKMRKSQSVNVALSSASNSNISGKSSNLIRRSEMNRSQSIGEEYTWNLPFLEELYLQDNQLECLPSALFQQPELKLLDLSNNKLRTLPPLFWFSPKLNELNLSLNLLCDLPSPVNCFKRQTFCSSDTIHSFSDGSSHIASSSLSKSISALSISSIATNSSIDSNRESGLPGNSNQEIQANLIPFELNLLKPWSGSVNILADNFGANNAGGLMENNNRKVTTDNFGTQTSQMLDESTGNLLTKSNSSNSGCSSRQTCVFTQLNLSHNGFDRVPFLLSCIANRLTHLNLSYNRLSSIFDPDYILGHYPLSLKHLDLSHNQIVDWFDLDSEMSYSAYSQLDSSFDGDSGEEVFCSSNHLCIHSHSLQPLQQQHQSQTPHSPPSQSSPFNTDLHYKPCPYKQHTRLDNLKTFILTNNQLKRIIVTRDELCEIVNQLSSNRKMAELISSVKSNSQFHISPISTENQKVSSFSSRFALKLSSAFGSTDDLFGASNSDSNPNNLINLNTKASRYAKLFFPNLSMLDVANNRLPEVPKTISFLCQLSVLNLSGNLELTTLPPEMGLLTKLWNLNTRGCLNLNEPLRSMIVSKTYKTCDIISYLNSILENSKPYSRMKLMLVGLQGIGKTSLLEQLRHEGTGRRHRPPDHWGKRMGNKSMGMKTPRGVTMSTVGVDLYDWTYERKPIRGNRDRSLSTTRMSAFQSASKQRNTSVESDSIGPITFRTWDFGGQKEYYATHQYFLSKRSIYLVMWKITDGEKGVQGIHSWLVNIQSRAPNSPVIIVGTHYDLIKEYYPPFFSSDLQNTIRDRYMSDSVDADKRGLPRVVASIEVSTKTRYNIRLLANLIYETACEIRSPGCKERLLEQKVPATYLALEDVVYVLATERKVSGFEPVLHSDQFRLDVIRLLKERHNLAFRDYSELQQATRFLHENGVLLHYEDANLKDLYFLDPQWLCDMLAYVVTIREINPFVKNGIMKVEHLLQLFKNTKSAPNDVQNFLLSLLNKFELALTWDNRTLLIPSLLPTEEQLQCGQPGCDIIIPLRSRLKIRRSSSIMDSNHLSSIKFEFKNELKFQELRDKTKMTIQESPVKSSDSGTAKEATTMFGGGTHAQPRQQMICNVTARARHNESIHRILLLSYVPCGFWSRLIARILADESVIEIIRSFYHLPSSAHNDPALISYLNTAKTKWHCWQTGFGLRYFDTFLLRVKELNLQPTNPAASDNPNNANRPPFLSKSNYPYDYQRIKFYLRQQKESSSTTVGVSNSSSKEKERWHEVYTAVQGASLIEIYLPNQSLQIDTNILVDNNDGEEQSNNKNNESGEVSGKYRQNSYTLEPNYEMITKLLVIIVEHIDTLLEDWYPSLGTRFIHTSDGRFLITRIVPCTSCMHCFVDETLSNCSIQSSTGGNRFLGTEDQREEVIISPDTADVDSFLVNFYKSEVKKATLQASKSEFNDSAISTLNTNDSLFEMQLKDKSSKQSLPTCSTPILSLYHPVYAFMVEECILAVYEDLRLECPTHGRLRIEKLAPDIMFCDLKDNFCIEKDQLRFGKLLGRGSFGFVFRGFYTPKTKRSSLNLTSSKVNKVASSSHKTTKDLTLIAKNKRSIISNSRFYVAKNNNTNNNSEIDQLPFNSFEVALKLLQPIRIELRSNAIRKADMEAYTAMKSKWERDPLQYSCKAYCTARTELNILASLKHQNIASIIGICPKPLALVLTLAPHGSLDTHIKSFRRSGSRIASLVLQQAFLQISKALEYLHQHHIIYRDLKSENVLVWSFPNVQTNSNYGISAVTTKTTATKLSPSEVDLKLADYGISRSSLPTGTKGFGGTEGFMAPEIMLFNGEEEYTEKVDCFSFAMFMYELCTLRFPFEGQEFAIRESILDGIRPALTQRDLEYLPESFIDLMTRCWAQEPAERPAISQIVSIISAPEFCSLRDVTILQENIALICAVGFEKLIVPEKEPNEPAANVLSDSQHSRKFGLCLSKIGKQIDYLESSMSKWNPIGHRLSCENLTNRTITSACVVGRSQQLWLGDSRACIHIHDLKTSSSTSVVESSQNNSDEFCKLICMIQLEFDNPSSLTAIKSLCWLPRANLMAISSSSGCLWLLNLSNLQEQLKTGIDLRVCLTSSELKMKQICNNGSMILCVASVDQYLPIQKDSSNDKTNEIEHLVDIWCGQSEGKITIFRMRPSDCLLINQTVVDHYDDHYLQQLMTASYIGSKIPLVNRNDVSQIVATKLEHSVYSVLNTGFVIYQWDVFSKQILHRLDCSKLAPCSESLMSISIEDHLKPGSCQITAIAVNDNNDELYIGTNLGCIVVTESLSLKPVTVFRPYLHEVKFIIILSDFYNNINDDFMGTQQSDDQFDPSQDVEQVGDEKSLKQRPYFALRSIQNASSLLWPFNKRGFLPKDSKLEQKQQQQFDPRIKRKCSPYSNHPFVTIGKGYRNLLDRFIKQTPTTDHQGPSNNYPNNNNNESITNSKSLGNLKDHSNNLSALIWDSGYWEF